MQRHFVLLACLLFGSPVIAEESRWRKLPLPPGRAETIREIALEQNTLWALANNGVFYWDGVQWQKPPGITVRGSVSATRMIGGGDRDLYCTQIDYQRDTGALYLLRQESLHRVAEFPASRTSGVPRFFVGRSGLLLQITREKFGVFVDGSWHYEDMPSTRFDIFEDQDLTYLCLPLSNLIFQIDARGNVRKCDCNLKLPGNDAESRPLLLASGMQLVRWGEGRVLVFQRRRPKPSIQCFELRDGKAVDVTALESKLQSSQIGSLFSSRDGSVWSLLSGAGSELSFVQISPEARMSVPVAIKTLEFRFRRSPQNVLEAQDGSMWFGLKDSIGVFDGTGFRRLAQETGYDVSGCSLLEDHQGTLYANNGSIYAYYRFTKPPGRLQPPVPIRIPQRTVWDFEARNRTAFKTACMVNDAIYLTDSDRDLVAIHADSGSQLFRRSLKPESGSLASTSVPLVLSVGRQTLELATSKELLHVDRSTGEIQSRESLSHDSRIAPIHIPTGRLVVPDYRSREVRVVDRVGKVLWRKALPGYLMAQPAVHDHFIVLQTRGSDYGGQTTLCLDLQDGTVLWSDQTDAYGQGVMVSDDGSLVVECDNWLSPSGTEAWVIGRTTDGKRKWHFRDYEQRVTAPMIDASTGHVYVMLSQGKVVCLNGENGEAIWQTSLPDALVRAGGASPYQPSWSPHFLQGDRIFVIDKGLTAHVLDARSGETIVRFLLEPDPPGGSSLSPRLIAAPWVTPQAIVSAFSHGVVSIPLPDELKSLRRFEEFSSPQIAAATCVPEPVCQLPWAAVCVAPPQPYFGQRIRSLCSRLRNLTQRRQRCPKR